MDFLFLIVFLITFSFANFIIWIQYIICIIYKICINRPFILLVSILVYSRLLVGVFWGSKVTCRFLTAWGLVTLNPHVVQGSSLLCIKKRKWVTGYFRSISLYILGGEKHNLHQKPNNFYLLQLSKITCWNSKNNRIIRDLTRINHGLVYYEK